MNMKKTILLFTVVLSAVVCRGEREYIWTEGKMPDANDRQFACMTDEKGEAASNRVAYLDWLKKPDNPNGAILIMISGGSYNNCCDVGLVRREWPNTFLPAGYQLVNFVYRTPRPENLPIYQSAWEDGQRAVRMVRSEAAKRGFDPERIGVISMSAGSHLATLLATSSETSAYEPVDDLDKIPCNINFAITGAIAYGLTTSAVGNPDQNAGVGGRPGAEFKFDSKTAPMCMLHGSKDRYSPLASTQIYRELRKRGVPAEVHVWSDRNHGGFWKDNWREVALGFLRQLDIDRRLGKSVDLMERFASDGDRDQARYMKENVWPEGMMPNASTNQCTPYLEWHFPKELKTKAIQIIYSGGSYNGNSPDGFEVAPTRRFLNAKGVTVVTMKYRVPRPKGMPKHVTAWQDLQRAIRIVRSRAAGYGLDPDRIGIMGSSAGGHLTLMGALSSTEPAYAPIDDLDKIPCNVQWGVGIYPAYSLTDGAEKPNAHGGNEDDAVPVPEFKFDEKCCPMVFVHGDGDGWAAMNSVKIWEKMREMGIHGDLHTLVKRPHCFHRKAAEGTGSYDYNNHIWEFLVHKGFVK